MSNEKNSRRINLCFKLSSPDQLRAHKILLEVENKTQYITDLILSNSDVTYEAKGTTTKEALKEVLMEILPTYMATHAAGRAPAAAVVAESSEQAMFEDQSDFENERKEEQHPHEASAVEDSINGSEDSASEDFGIMNEESGEVDSVFLDGLMSLMPDDF